METVSQFAGHADTAMTSSTYGWVSDKMAQQQLVQIAGAQKASTPAPVALVTDLSPDVMLEAMKYAQSSGQPLDVVLSILRGDNASKAAE